MKYLIGALHISFKLLWEPLTKLIASHEAGLDKTVFWELYRQMLHDAARKCGKLKKIHFQKQLCNQNDFTAEEFMSNLRIFSWYKCILN